MSEPNPAPAPAPTPTIIPPAVPPAPEKVYDADYVRRLRAENDNHRQEADAAKAAATLAEQAATTRIAEATASANKRIIGAELRAEATKAGMVDLDALVMLDADKSGVKLGDDGAVIGAAEALAALKVAKPFLFGAVKTGNTETPRAGQPEHKTASQMTDAEYKAARAEMLARR